MTPMQRVRAHAQKRGWLSVNCCNTTGLRTFRDFGVGYALTPTQSGDWIAFGRTAPAAWRNAAKKLGLLS